MKQKILVTDEETLLSRINDLEQKVDNLTTLLSDFINKKKPVKKEYLNKKETAKMLRISLPTLNSYEKKGIIPSYLLGARILFERHEVEEAMRERRFFIGYKRKEN